MWRHRNDSRKIPTYPWENKTSPSGDILKSAKSGSSANVTCSAVVKNVSGTQMFLPARPSNMRLSSPSCASCSSLQECLRYMRKAIVCQKHTQNRNIMLALLSAAFIKLLLWFVKVCFYQCPRNGVVFWQKKSSQAALEVDNCHLTAAFGFSDHSILFHWQCRKHVLPQWEGNTLKNKESIRTRWIKETGAQWNPARSLWAIHGDVIKWKYFPRYWPFVRGIHRPPVNSPHKASDAELWCFFWSAPAETVNK